MRHASLFSGIGGFDLAAQWMGWENVFQVEKDTFCQKVLQNNFPNTKRYGDIKEFDGTKYSGTIDILTGGFPCQPFSLAGKRLGTDDTRHLWPEMLRVVREVRPAWVIGENVFGIINWSNGMVFEMVCNDLENEGYQITPFILPAAGAGSPHRRDRCWFVAHSNRSIQQPYRYGKVGFEEIKTEGKKNKRKWDRIQSTGAFDQGLITQPDRQGLAVGESIFSNARKKLTPSERSYNEFDRFPSVEPGIRGGNDGVPNRVDRVKSLGNAIVPQVAFQIFKAIEAITL